jgi:hypothetical protein
MLTGERMCRLSPPRHRRTSGSESRRSYSPPIGHRGVKGAVSEKASCRKQGFREDPLSASGWIAGWSPAARTAAGPFAGESLGLSPSALPRRRPHDPDVVLLGERPADLHGRLRGVARTRVPFRQCHMTNGAATVFTHRAYQHTAYLFWRHTTGATYAPFEPLIASALAMSYAPLSSLIQRWA